MASPKLTEREREILLESMKIGIGGAENGGNYKGKNRDTGATGKYQFMPQWFSKWGNTDRKKGVLNIKAFADENKELFGEIKSMDDFENNPKLQEAYFAHYVDAFIVPRVESLLKTNPGNFNPIEIASLIHFKGTEGGGKYVKSGKLPDEIRDAKTGRLKDVSGKDYFNNVYKALEKGLPEEMKSEVNRMRNYNNISQNPFRDRGRAVFEYQNRLKKINDLNLPEIEKNEMIRDMYLDILESGNQDMIDIYNQGLIDQEREKQAEDIKKIDALTRAMGNSRVFSPKGQERESDDSWLHFDDVDEEMFKNLGIDKNNKKFWYDKKNKKVSIKVGDFKEYLNNEINPLLKEYNLSEQELKFQEGWSWRQFKDGYVNLMSQGVFRDILGGRQDALKGFQYDRSQLKSPGLKTSMIDWESLRPELEARQSKQIEEAEQSKSEATESTEKDSRASDVVKKKEEKEDEDVDVYLNKLNTEKGVIDSRVKGFNDNPEFAPSKRELPIDALMGLAMNIEGNRKAKEKLPLRDEEISLAVENITRELKKRSEQGLPPEVEAEMKSKLADSYQAGLESIVNASGGNRNLVLGNIGQLEANKVRGLMQIQIQDYIAKENAFAKYAEAEKYINDFETQKKIANHQIKLSEALEKRQEGKQIAALGLKKLIDDIAYEKQFGPNSPYGHYIAAKNIQMYGFNPNAKDDGSPGTRSHYEKQKRDFEEKQVAHMTKQAEYLRLSPNNREAIQRLYRAGVPQGEIDEAISKMLKMKNFNASSVTAETFRDVLSIGQEDTPSGQGTSTPGLITLSPENLAVEGGATDESIYGEPKNPEGVLDYTDSRVTNNEIVGTGTDRPANIIQPPPIDQIPGLADPESVQNSEASLATEPTTGTSGLKPLSNDVFMARKAQYDAMIEKQKSTKRNHYLSDPKYWEDLYIKRMSEDPNFDIDNDRSQYKNYKIRNGLLESSFTGVEELDPLYKIARSIAIDKIRRIGKVSQKPTQNQYTPFPLLIPENQEEMIRAQGGSFNGLVK